jgi:hypothetical protein
MAASPPGHKGAAHLVDGVLRAGVHCESLEAAAASPWTILFLQLRSMTPRGISAPLTPGGAVAVEGWSCSVPGERRCNLVFAGFGRRPLSAAPSNPVRTTSASPCADGRG